MCRNRFDPKKIYFQSFKNKEFNYLEMSDNAKVLIIKLYPDSHTKTTKPVLLIPGFMAYVEQWKEVALKLVENGFPVYIFETREKKSSTSNVTDPLFNTEGLIEDLSTVIKKLDFNDSFYVVGNSLGTAIIQKHLIDINNPNLLPKKAVLLEAVYTSEPLRKMIEFAKKPVLFRIGLWVIKTFAPLYYLPLKRKDSFTYWKSVKRMKFLDIEKTRIGLLCSESLKLKDEIKQIETPILIIGRENDPVHPKEQAEYIHQQLQNSEYITVVDDAAIHSKKVGQLISNYFNAK